MICQAQRKRKKRPIVRISLLAQIGVSFFLVQFQVTKKMETECGPVTPIDAGAVEAGAYLMIQQRPCQVISVSKTGKCGRAQLTFVGKDVFTGETHEGTGPLTDTITQPVLSWQEYEFLGHDDDYTLLMSLTDSDKTRDDVVMPGNDIGEALKQGFEDDLELSVNVISWGDTEEGIVAWKQKAED